jgi:saposin
MLKDKNNEQEIKDALDSLCSYLPNSVSTECKTFVDTYTDMIIEMLTNDVTPKEVI